MLTAVAAHLDHASCTALVLYAALGAITVGLGPFAVANLVDHILVARRISQGVR
ncbi:hypothetical protein [Methylobacterium pseudosasicola]|uniref:Uncharacterized protein n=1 Tax=Methylobacterium pseudosasicola TaxID=582667 RepID=A0A1I4URJ5_9HYPH|nr:hypothetical protein [Methylobacterium pseudosasicola]SFM91535.1 hypothetical protein SAMN05192568_107521 [Methylobacterium pseudosasicola]